jgi:NAD(P)-dependent dehydrogenase (short-subunit alcohol dehydrogenase family)
MSGRLDGKVAIVTGAASGIGRATAAALGREGAAVVLTDINAARLDEAVEEITGAGATAAGRVADVASEEAWREVVAAAADTFGRLDVLHNCAANTDVGHLARDTVAVDIDPAHFMGTLEVNLLGTALGCKHSIPAMLASGGGSIINTSSICGAAGTPALIAYGAAKGGINALTKYVATAYGKAGVRCNAVAPGVIVTDTNQEYSGADLLRSYERVTLTPRLGTPGDVAHLVVFLGSDESAFITGQIIGVDGGFLSHFPSDVLEPPTPVTA